MESLAAIGPDPAVLSANLRALSRTCPALARRIAEVPTRTDVEFIRAGDGGVTARLGDGRWLASRHRPIEEGRRFGERADVLEHGAIAVAGFGLGHHLAPIAERVGRQGVLIVLETDLALLRAVFERVACSAWIDGTHLVLVDRAEEASAITGGLAGMEALVAMGLQLLDHPPSSARLGGDSSAFAGTVTRTLRALRTTIMTTLVQSGTTLRNLVMNADRYATLRGIGELQGSERGRAGIVISAGPSLARAMEAMGEEGVRDRFVLIAVQTVLRPLLDRGIRPHYVVALDHHEISTRFYEGLREEDVRGVTLVAEAKVNPGVLEAFPGEIRLCADERLDALLGESLARSRGALRPGATVAHLAYELARYLGCDPVLLVGQDLAFSDGQYYADGAAIHDTWACELSSIRTLEMFEHERIVRQRHQLIRARDHLGRAVYTDEQMHSYLVQFGELFERDALRGLTTIDCGDGLPKAHTRVEALGDALARYGADAIGPWSFDARALLPPAGEIDRDRAIRELRERLTRVGRDARRIRTLCTRTASLLRTLRERQGDQGGAARLIGKINRCRDEVVSLEPAWELTQFLNQSGALERARADRLLALDGERSAVERQRAQIDRDERNVERMGEAARTLADLLDTGLGVLDGRPRLLREGAVAPARGERSRVALVVLADFARGGLGNARSIDHELADGHSAMSLTLRRAAQSREHDAIIVLSDEPDRAAREVRRAGVDAEVVAIDGSSPRDRAIATARVLAPACWRGGLAGMTVHDEVTRPRVLRDILRERSFDAACTIGADWCLVDPTLIDGVIARARAHPQTLSFVLTQAPPGLAPMLLTRSIVEDLVAQEDRAGPLASVGGVLGYVPDAGRADPIGKDACVRIDPALRDLHARVIADSPIRQREIGRILAGTPSIGSFSGAALARALGEYGERCAARPTHLTIELCTGRLTSGERGRWLTGGNEPAEREPMTLQTAAGVLTRLAAACPDAAVTIAGAGDPLQHPEFDQFIRLARDAGVAGVHVRTDLLADEATIDRLMGSPVGIISVDLMAHERATYERIMGIDAFDRACANIERLIEKRRARGNSGMVAPWIVPRITRCDGVYEQIEAFHDQWISRLGCCVIDPLLRAIGGQRIRPLTIPRSARARLEGERLTLRSDGTLWRGARPLGPARERSILEVLDAPARERLVA